MGEFGANGSYNSADQLPPTAPNYLPESNGPRFYDYIQPARNTNTKTLQGGLVENETRPNMQFRNGIADNQVRSNVRNDVPLQGAVKETELRANVQDNIGIPTTCLRIEDQRKDLDRDVFLSPFTGNRYHNVFIKQSDDAVIQRARMDLARGIVNLEEVNLYDKTGHLIQPVRAGACGGWFSVDYKPSTVVLNLYDSPGGNNAPTYLRSNNRATTIQEVKQKYHKYKPMVDGLLRQARSFRF